MALCEPLDRRVYIISEMINQYEGEMTRKRGMYRKGTRLQCAFQALRLLRGRRIDIRIVPNVPKGDVPVQERKLVSHARTGLVHLNMKIGQDLQRPVEGELTILVVNRYEEPKVSQDVIDLISEKVQSFLKYTTRDRRFLRTVVLH